MNSLPARALSGSFILHQNAVFWLYLSFTSIGDTPASSANFVQRIDHLPSLRGGSEGEDASLVVGCLGLGNG
jgi:hypothetical protein